VEEVFHAANAKTALKLAHVRGVALLAIAEAGVGLAEYSPLEVKMSVVGYGRAEKCQVQVMVRSLLRLPEADRQRKTRRTPWPSPSATPRTKPPAAGWPSRRV
jgi:crossover junction endodeoxyribonuclease RuvC